VSSERACSQACWNWLVNNPSYMLIGDRSSVIKEMLLVVV
jgi:hypothetical protein